MKTNSTKTNRKIWLGAAMGCALLLMFATPRTAFGQWTTNGNDISNSNSGNVGIGLNPSYKFDVMSGTGVVARFGSSASANTQVLFDATSGYNSSLIFQNGGVSKWFMGNQAANNRFSFVESTGAVEVFSILQSGYVGIGTTSPSSILTVQTTGPDSGATKYLRIKNTSSYTGLLLDPGQSGDAGWLVMGGYPNAGDFTVRELNVGNYLTIKKTSGNVGIGTTTPGYKLDVNGTVNATGLNINGSPVTTSQWATSGSTINYSAGNVGIGTTAPGTSLEVYKSQDAVVRLLGLNNPSSGSSAQAAFSFYEGTTEKAKLATNSSGATGYVGGSNALQIWNFLNAPTVFGTNSAERMRIAANGNVGIGTSAPSQLLNIALSQDANTILQIDNVNSGTSASARLNVSNDGTINFGTLMAGGTGYTAIPYWQDSFVLNSGATASGGLKLRAATGGIGFSTDGGTTTSNVFINSSGNVGIGTTSPGALLEVNKSQNAGTMVVVDNGYTTASNAAFSGLFFKQAGSNRFFFGSINSNNTAQVGGAGAVHLWNFIGGPILFATSNAEQMRIDAAGNVGIGTTSPVYKLDVNGAVNATDVKIGGTSITTSQWATSGSTINYSAGNVGIGTTSPTSSIGWGTSGGKLLDVGNGTGSNGIVFHGPNGSELGFGNSTSAGLFLDSAGSSTASQNMIAFRTEDSASQYTPTERMRIDSSGNVGIGTTTPGYKLDVNGTVNATDLKIGGSSITSSQWTTSGSNINYASSTGNVGIDKSSPTYKLDVNGTINATDLKIGGSSVTSSQWTTSGSNINYAAAGNVGIGTTSPASKLDVTGNAHVSGNLTVDGNIAAKYQDMAEWVPSSEQMPTGTVVVLDSTKSNQVISSSQAYDTRVAGVISAQPGIALGEGGEGKVLVATTGRVLVEVDASKSPIHIGDLLVTSDVPGMAMKSEPVNVGGVKLHRPGTLIGKALEPLEKGKRKILVLLSLQ